MTAPGPAPRRGLAGFAEDVRDRHQPTAPTPAPAPATPPPTPAPTAPDPAPAGEATAAAVRAAHGLPADATADELFAAFTASMDDVDTEAAAAANATAPDGVVAVSTGEWERLRTDAALPAEIDRQRAARARASVVDAAIGRGAIAPAHRDGYLRALAVDFDATAAALAALPNERAVPLGEVGHGQDQDTSAPAGWFDQTPPAGH